MNLAPLTDPALVVSAIAQALDVKEHGGQSLLASVQAYVRKRAVLLVLDNFEQVLAAGLMVAELLQAGERLTVLVTSRTPLHLRGEREVVVEPLAVPRPPPPPLDVLSQYAAVQLFIARAQSVKPDFQVTTANAPAVAEICARLDGLPLAIELAAARVKILPPEMLLQRLDSRLRILTGGARDLPARQRTLRATIDWSYQLLTPPEQTLLARLAVFVGGWTLEAVETVCHGAHDLDIDVLDNLQVLIERNLVRQAALIEGEPRFIMLETIREYALERLAASGEAELIRQRHDAFFLNLVAVAERSFSHRQGWAQRFEAEHHNLHEVLRRALEREDGETVLKLGSSLMWYWIYRGHLDEGRRWLIAGLKVGDSALPMTRAKALGGVAGLAWRQGDYAYATDFLTQALLHFRELGDTESSAWILCNLGKVALDQGDPRRATSFIEESLTLFRELSHEYGTAWSLMALAEVALAQGDQIQATGLFEASLALFRKLSDQQGCAHVCAHLGEMAIVQGQHDQGQARLEESLALFLQLGFTFNIPFILADMASVAMARHDPHRGARLWGAAEALRDTLAIPVPPGRLDRYNLLLAALRGALSGTTFAALCAEGSSMSLQQVAAYAIGRTDGSSSVA